MKPAKLAAPLAALSVAALCFATAPAACAAEPAAKTLKEPLKAPGIMVQEDPLGNGSFSYDFSPTLEGVAPSTWPADGWYRLVTAADHIDVAVAPSKKGQAPDFLRSIIRQQENVEPATPAETTPPEASAEQTSAIYLRVPGASLHAGSVPVYLFKNGSSHLNPKLDNRYELTLGAQPFAFSVQNGQRSKNGTPYGDGAHYRIEYDGQAYEYDLDGLGWDSHIAAIADLDGDGKPDFIVYVGSGSGTTEVILLSSKAKPGKNPPSASLAIMEGC